MPDEKVDIATCVGVKEEDLGSRQRVLLSLMSDSKLKKDYTGLYDAIYNAESFGTRDLLNLEAIENELEKRGYVIEESKTVRIFKGAPKKGE